MAEKKDNQQQQPENENQEQGQPGENQEQAGGAGNTNLTSPEAILMLMIAALFDICICVPIVNVIVNVIGWLFFGLWAMTKKGGRKMLRNLLLAGIIQLIPVISSFSWAIALVTANKIPSCWTGFVLKSLKTPPEKPSLLQKIKSKAKAKLDSVKAGTKEIAGELGAGIKGTASEASGWIASKTNAGYQKAKKGMGFDEGWKDRLKKEAGEDFGGVARNVKEEVKEAFTKDLGSSFKAVGGDLLGEGNTMRRRAARATGSLGKAIVEVPAEIAKDLNPFPTIKKESTKLRKQATEKAGKWISKKKADIKESMGLDEGWKDRLKKEAGEDFGGAARNVKEEVKEAFTKDLGSSFKAVGGDLLGEGNTMRRRAARATGSLGKAIVEVPAEIAKDLNPFPTIKKESTKLRKQATEKAGKWISKKKADIKESMGLDEGWKDRLRKEAGEDFGGVARNVKEEVKEAFTKDLGSSFKAVGGDLLGEGNTMRRRAARATGSLGKAIVEVPAEIAKDLNPFPTIKKESTKLRKQATEKAGKWISKKKADIKESMGLDEGWKDRLKKEAGEDFGGVARNVKEEVKEAFTKDLGSSFKAVGGDLLGEGNTMRRRAARATGSLGKAIVEVPAEIAKDLNPFPTIKKESTKLRKQATEKAGKWISKKKADIKESMGLDEGWKDRLRKEAWEDFEGVTKALQKTSDLAMGAKKIADELKAEVKSAAGEVASDASTKAKSLKAKLNAKIAEGIQSQSRADKFNYAKALKDPKKQTEKREKSQALKKEVELVKNKANEDFIKNKIKDPGTIELTLDEDILTGPADKEDINRLINRAQKDLIKKATIEQPTIKLSPEEDIYEKDIYREPLEEMPDDNETNKANEADKEEIIDASVATPDDKENANKTVDKSPITLKNTTKTDPLLERTVIIGTKITTVKETIKNIKELIQKQSNTAKNNIIKRLRALQRLGSFAGHENLLNELIDKSQKAIDVASVKYFNSKELGTIRELLEEKNNQKQKAA